MKLINKVDFSLRFDDDKNGATTENHQSTTNHTYTNMKNTEIMLVLAGVNPQLTIKVNKSGMNVLQSLKSKGIGSVVAAFASGSNNAKLKAARDAEKWAAKYLALTGTDMGKMAESLKTTLFWTEANTLMTLDGVQVLFMADGKGSFGIAYQNLTSKKTYKRYLDARLDQKGVKLEPEAESVSQTLKASVAPITASLDASSFFEDNDEDDTDEVESELDEADSDEVEEVEDELDADELV